MFNEEYLYTNFWYKISNKYINIRYLNWHNSHTICTKLFIILCQKALKLKPISFKMKIITYLSTHENLKF